MSVYLLFAHLNKVIYKNIENHAYNTRNENILEFPKNRLRLYKKCPNFTSLKISNQPPNNYKQLNAKKFKHEEKMLLIKQCYYSLTEYLKDAILVE